MTLDQKIAQGEQSVKEMSEAIRDLQKMRDRKEIETMQLRARKQKEEAGNG